MNTDPFAPLSPRQGFPARVNSTPPRIMLSRSSIMLDGMKSAERPLLEEVVSDEEGLESSGNEFETVEPSTTLNYNSTTLSSLPPPVESSEPNKTVPVMQPIPLYSLSSGNRSTPMDYSILPVGSAYSSNNNHLESPSISARNSPKLGYQKSTSPSSHATRYSVGTHQLLSSRISVSARIGILMNSTISWLILYFCFNLGLTLFNKLVLQGFPFPWTLTGIQMLAGSIGTQIALERGYFVKSKLTNKEGAVMLAFSILYSINIAVSNLSLHLVTVPFHQVVRAMTPLFTMALSTLLFQKRYSTATYISLLPVIIGVVFATYGDYYFTTWGLVLTLFGTLLAALKTIVTNRIQVGRLKLHPLDLLIRMSPLAFVQCVLCAWWSGELERVRIYGATEMTGKKALALGINGVIAFGLNVVSFTANKKTSPLTMTVAANVKQVLTIILAVVIFNLSLNPTNIFGIILTLSGGAWYARVEFLEKQKIVVPTSLESEKIMR